jgi:hypothetical protein
MNVLYSRGDAVRSRAKRANGSPLDPAAYEAIERFARVMVRCGFDARAVAEAFGLALAAARNEAIPLPQNTRDLPEASHLVTLWSTSPEYVDEAGNPLPLPRRGPQRSVESLSRLIDRTVDVTELLRYLIRTRTVRKVGKRYMLSRRWISLRGVSGAAHTHSIRGLLGMLRTLEHNLVVESEARAWFEYTAQNPRFPVSQLDAFDKLVRRTGLGALRKFDVFMRHCEVNRNPSEPTVWLGVGIHRFQHNASTVFASPTRTQSTRTVRGRRR